MKQHKMDGGASGIGLETARVLALRNAHVIIAARNIEAANEARKYILQDNEDAKVDVLKLDLASLKSVRDFAHNFVALNLPLNILIAQVPLYRASYGGCGFSWEPPRKVILHLLKNDKFSFRNNAGIMFCPYQLSEDGFEMQFATNHLGHFYLTNLLLDTMKATAASTGIEGRIVNLSSVAHIHTYEEGIAFDRINDESSYDDKRAYGQSKLANILHANELSRQLKAAGVNITVNSLHPGLIMTNLFRYSGVLMRVLKFMTNILWKNVPQGAATTCYVALHPSLKGVTGKYFVDCNEFSSSRFGRSEDLAKRLWEVSNQLIEAAERA